MSRAEDDEIARIAAEADRVLRVRIPPADRIASVSSCEPGGPLAGMPVGEARVLAGLLSEWHQSPCCLAPGHVDSTRARLRAAIALGKGRPGAPVLMPRADWGAVHIELTQFLSSKCGRAAERRLRPALDSLAPAAASEPEAVT